jgi:DNA-binding IclR family transcriptional regulator
MRSTVRSAARVLDVLEYLAGREQGASLSECVVTLDLPKSSTLMLLRTVLARGYVTKAEADRYRLNDIFRTYGFGWGGHRCARLIALAKPIMEELCRAVDETVLLGAPEGPVVRTLSKVVSEQTIRYDVALAKPSPFYCTAMGRTIAAFSPNRICEAMLQASPREKIAPHTVTDIDALRTIVESVRELGYAVVEEEFALGGTGIAAPIFDAKGAIFAVLDVGCVTTRFHTKRDRIIQELTAAASTLSHLLATKADDQNESLREHS